MLNSKGPVIVVLAAIAAVVAIIWLIFIEGSAAEADEFGCTIPISYRPIYESVVKAKIEHIEGSLDATPVDISADIDIVQLALHASCRWTDRNPKASPAELACYNAFVLATLNRGNDAFKRCLEERKSIARHIGELQNLKNFLNSGDYGVTVVLSESAKTFQTDEVRAVGFVEILEKVCAIHNADLTCERSENNNWIIGTKSID
jgi:hypothetical protein